MWDIGFSDEIFPRSIPVIYPTILEFPSPALQGYNPESVIAEKFEAMTKLGIINTRMKDFFDIWILSRQLSFDGELLQKAIKTTFIRRKTSLDMLPDSLSEVFYESPVHIKRWAQFLQKI